MNRARSAESHSAAKLGSRQPQDVPHVPEQWHIGIAIERAIYPVYLQLHHQDLLVFFVSEAFCVPRQMETN
jgi:hypothetical protein